MTLTIRKLWLYTNYRVGQLNHFKYRIRFVVAFQLLLLTCAYLQFLNWIPQTGFFIHSISISVSRSTPTEKQNKKNIMMFLLMHIILCSSSYSSFKKTRKLNVQNYHLCGPNNYDSLAAGPIIFQIRYVHCVCTSHFFECFFLLRSMTTIQQTATAMTEKKIPLFSLSRK